MRLIGAILGDMIGAPFEFDRGDKTKDFELFTENTAFTDDTVMTIAVADALLSVAEDAGEKEIKDAVVSSMLKWGAKYPNAGYGGAFAQWLHEPNPQPYGSWGNGAAMRISPVAWMYSSLSRVVEVARWVTEVTHDHLEGIRGAEATVSAIYWAAEAGLDNIGSVKKKVERKYFYDLDRTCDEIRPTYYHVESCQETVPQAIIAFLESTDFEDAIRNAVSLGGDSDTLACITGSIAEAFYGGVPRELENECLKRLTPDIIDVLERFNAVCY